jgi:hypothetical protein
MDVEVIKMSNNPEWITSSAYYEEMLERYIKEKIQYEESILKYPTSDYYKECLEKVNTNIHEERRKLIIAKKLEGIRTEDYFLKMNGSEFVREKGMIEEQISEFRMELESIYKKNEWNWEKIKFNLERIINYNKMLEKMTDSSYKDKIKEGIKKYEADVKGIMEEIEYFELKEEFIEEKIFDYHIILKDIKKEMLAFVKSREERDIEIYMNAPFLYRVYIFLGNL